MQSGEQRPRKVTRHAATDAQKCYEMRDRYGWNLIDVERAGSRDSVLKVNCVFEGEAEFPKSGIDYSQGDIRDDE